MRCPDAKGEAPADLAMSKYLLRNYTSMDFNRLNRSAAQVTGTYRGLSSNCELLSAVAENASVVDTISQHSDVKTLGERDVNTAMSSVWLPSIVVTVQFRWMDGSMCLGELY